MSPGSNCKGYSERVDRKRSKLSARSKTRQYKKKRRERRETRSSKVRQLEDREGVQYESGLGLRESLTLPVEIPSHIVRPEFETIVPQTGLKKVVIDLETSSRGISVIFFFLHEKSLKEELKKLRADAIYKIMNYYNSTGNINFMYYTTKPFRVERINIMSSLFLHDILDLLTIHCMKKMQL